MSETYATRKGTRVEMIETVPAFLDDPEITAGVTGTVLENTNSQAYKVVFDDDRTREWTVGAWQVRKIYEPPTDAELLAEAVAALRPFAHLGATELQTGDDDDVPVFLLAGEDRFEVDSEPLTLGQFRRAAEVLAKLEGRK